MSKSRELQSITELVKQLLTEQPETRNDDYRLYCTVCRIIGGSSVVRKPFEDVLLHRNEYNLPTLETVGRVRRKLQATYSELSADSVVEAGRMLNEESFRDYARKQV